VGAEHNASSASRRPLTCDARRLPGDSAGRRLRCLWHRAGTSHLHTPIWLGKHAPATDLWEIVVAVDPAAPPSLVPICLLIHSTEVGERSGTGKTSAPTLTCGNGSCTIRWNGLIYLSRWRHGFEPRWGCHTPARGLGLLHAPAGVGELSAVLSAVLSAGVGGQLRMGGIDVIQKRGNRWRVVVQARRDPLTGTRRQLSGSALSEREDIRPRVVGSFLEHLQ
jgi:hypothetical protein